MSTYTVKWINPVKVFKGYNQNASPCPHKHRAYTLISVCGYCKLADTLGNVSLVALGVVECGAGVLEEVSG